MNNYVRLKPLQKRFLGAEHFHWYYKGNGGTKYESRKTGMMLVFFVNTLDWYKASQIGSSQGCLPKEWTLPWGSCVCSTEVMRINGQEFEFHTRGIRASVMVTFLLLWWAAPPNAPLETKGFLTSHGLKSVVNAVRAETQAEATERSCLLACSLQIAQSAFLYNLGPLFQEWQCPQWAGPSHTHH